MAEHGVDLESPRLVDFEHVFVHPRSAVAFEAAVGEIVDATELFSQEPDEEGGTSGWEVQCRVRMVPSHASTTATEQRLAAIAERHGGRADGWGMLSNADGSPAE